MSAHSILVAYFGYPLGAVYSNLVASAICGLLVYLRMKAKLTKTHQALAAQAARHHAELHAQATAHKNELRHLADRHHQEALDRADAHHEAVKAHITAVHRPPAAARRKPGGG